MPKPVFIVCGESVVDDKNSNKMSIFNIVEKIAFAKLKQGEQKPVPLFSVGVLAVWKKERNETDVEFESEFALDLPNSGTTHSLGVAPFTFLPDKDTWRFALQYSGAAPIDGDGTLYFRHRVRRKGTTEWSMQSYPIQIEEIKTEAKAEKKETVA